ncbi:hypothetical protein ACP275_08G016300 [Erythranthe tilingii]
MDTRIISSVVLVLLFLCGLNLIVEGDEDYAGLSFGFYNKTCPQLEKIVEDVISSTSKQDPRTPAALLRLLFNDCAATGCDASILLDAKNINDSEIGSFSNWGIKKRELIGQIKSTVEKTCPGQVSCADILVLAAREAVAFSQGPKIQVPLGRRDSSIAYTSRDADELLPPVYSFYGSVIESLREFGSGMSDEESIALLGAHTIGTTHCVNIQFRTNFTGDNVDLKYLKKLRKICPSGSLSNYNTSLPNDRTPYKFDNTYFSDIASGRGLLLLDLDLGYDLRAVEHVARFGTNQEYFFKVFSSAFVKLSTTNILTGKAGEIRRQCNQLNGI